MVTVTVTTVAVTMVRSRSVRSCAGWLACDDDAWRARAAGWRGGARGRGGGCPAVLPRGFVGRRCSTTKVRCFSSSRYLVRAVRVDGRRDDGHDRRAVLVGRVEEVDDLVDRRVLEHHEHHHP